MQATFSVTINGRGGVKKIKEIDRAAKTEDKSRSEFMVWLYDEYMEKKSRPIETRMGPTQ